MSNVVPLFVHRDQPRQNRREPEPAQPAQTALTWDELVQQNPHLPKQVQNALRASLSSLERLEQDPVTPGRSICVDASLSALVQLLEPLNRGASVTAERLKELSVPAAKVRAEQYAAACMRKARGKRKAPAADAADTVDAAEEATQDDE